MTNANYIVEAAGTDNEALEFIDENDYDLFFIDIHLPELAGIKLIKTLRAIMGYQSTPILAVTTTDPEALKQKGETLGITDWVRKPISPESVISLLKKMGMTNTQHVQSLV